MFNLKLSHEVDNILELLHSDVEQFRKPLNRILRSQNSKTSEVNILTNMLCGRINNFNDYEGHMNGYDNITLYRGEKISKL